MEQPQELQLLNKRMAAPKVDENDKNGPETWYKVVVKTGTEEVHESSSRSEDELSMSQEEGISEEIRPQVSHRATLTRSKPNPAIKLNDSETLKALENDYRDLQEAYDDARHALQSSGRENRDQSLELRDLKRRLTKLQEQSAQLREQNGLLREAYQTHQARGEKLSRSERSKYSEHIEMLENHISHLEHERHKRETHMEFLTEQTREANDGKERLEADARKLQRQMRELSANLTECKDDLLRLQPTSQVSDNEISERFSNLDQQIAGWVDDKTEDSTMLEAKFGSIKTVDDLPELLRMFATPDHLRVARKYPNSQPLLLRYFIHCYLQTFILSSDVYLFGLDGRNIALVQGVEQGMKQLEPRRDEKTLRNWRSETLLGLLQMDHFREEQSRQAHLASQTLSAALSSLVSTSTSDPHDLHQQIILPSVRLASQLRLSARDYRLIFHPFSLRGSSSAASARNNNNNNSPAYGYEIANSRMVDLATHKVIRPDSALKVGEDGRIGEEMLVVAPALVREGGGGGRVMVCKATVLVRLDEPMGKRGRGIRALGAWTPSWFGGGADGVE